MFDEIGSTDIVRLALAAIAVAVSLGLLPPSKVRTYLILVWGLAPLWLVLWATVMTAYDGRSDWPFVVGFPLVFTIVLLPPWAASTIFPYKLTSRLREIQRGS